MSKARQCMIAMLVVLAIALLGFGWWRWSKANEDAEFQNGVNGWTEALTGRELDDVEPDHTTAIGSFIAGGFAAVAVVIIGATARPAPKPPSMRSSDLAGQLLKLSQMHATGALSTDEYVAAKKKLLIP